MITRRWHDASSFERLSGRRVSQEHGSKAAGTRTAAAEAAGPAGGRRRGRRLKQKADEHGFSSGCTDVNCGTWIPGISVKTAILGSRAQNFLRLRRAYKEGALRAAGCAGPPPFRAPPSPPRRGSLSRDTEPHSSEAVSLST